MPSIVRYEGRDARTMHPFDQIRDLPCRTDPELFFPDRSRSGAPGVVLCNGCDIRSVCLAWALKTGQGFGTWGGMTATARARIKTQPARRDALIREGARAAVEAGLDLPALTG